MISPPGINQRLVPSWLDAACVLARRRTHHRPVEFRYLHLGCGAGATTALVAALHPEAQVLGVDPRAWAIADADELGAAAGLANLRYRCARTEAIADEIADGGVDADHPDGAIDVLASDRSLCSTGSAGRAAVAQLARVQVVPGGIATFGYRALAGWAEGQLLHRAASLVADELRGSPTERAHALVELFGRLAVGGAVLMQRPRIEGLLDQWESADPVDIAREVLGSELNPLSLATVLELFHDSDLEFVGSAQLLDDVGAALADPIRQIVDGVDDLLTRELLRDLVTHQTERTDVFVRGARHATEADIDEWATTTSVMIDAPERVDRSVVTSSGPVPLDPAVATAVRGLAGHGPTAVAELTEHLASVMSDDSESADPMRVLRLLLECDAGGLVVECDSVDQVRERLHRLTRALEVARHPDAAADRDVVARFAHRLAPRGRSAASGSVDPLPTGVPS